MYPPDFTDKEGNPFWRLPKRVPSALEFTHEDELVSQFIIAFACLRAKIFSIEIPEEIRDKACQKDILEAANNKEIPEFVPNEEKAKAIAKENAGDEDKEEEAPEEQANAENENEVDGNDYEKLIEQFKKIKSEIKSDDIKPEEFEKDDDTNYHIDAIHSLANLRSRNYTLDPMDWMTVKIKAGRIIPALATTTASIAGLQTLELVKVLKQVKVEDVKNAFLNLAVPILTPE